MAEDFDPYAVLGVSKDASPELIRAAYRAKAKELHPDAGGNEIEFVALVAAYAVVGDAERRLKYDQTGCCTDEEVNLHADALATVRTVVDSTIIQMTQQGVNPLQQDLIAIAKASLGKAINEVVTSAADLRKSADAALKIAARFHKDSGENFLRRMIEDKARDFNRKADFQVREKKRLELALAIVSDYRFDFDNIQTQFAAGGLGSTVTVMRMR